VEAIPLMRIASGSQMGMHEGLQILQWSRKLIGDDGNMYHPLRGRPWALMIFCDARPHDSRIRDGQYTEGSGCWDSGMGRGRTLTALAAWYSLTKDENLARDMKMIVDGLVKGRYAETPIERSVLGPGAIL
jgi:hypothetical protein